MKQSVSRSVGRSVSQSVSHTDRQMASQTDSQTVRSIIQTTLLNTQEVPSSSTVMLFNMIVSCQQHLIELL